MITVLGRATAEEVAAVLAVLTRPARPADDPYTRWRRTREAALRRSLPH